MELLPCPFCGGTDLTDDGERYHWVKCCGCLAEGPARDGLAAWNRRAANAPADPALLASVAEWRDATDEEVADLEEEVREASARVAELEAEYALARFGARIANDYHRGKYGFVSADGDWLDIDAASTGVKEYQGAADLAPGIADAIARLLAPDWAASEGVTDGD